MIKNKIQAQFGHVSDILAIMVIWEEGDEGHSNDLLDLFNLLKSSGNIFKIFRK